MNDETRDELEDLLEVTRDLLKTIDLRRERGELLHEGRLTTRTVVQEFDEETRVPRKLGFETNVKQSWAVSDRHALVKETIKGSGAVHNFIKKASARGFDNEQAVLNKLESFLHKMAIQAYDSPTQSTELRSCARFLRSLNGVTQRWEVQAAIAGVTLRCEQLEINHSIALRKTRREDFETEAVESPGLGRRSLSTVRFPVLQLKIVTNGVGAEAPRAALSHFLSVLRLYTGAPVFMIRASLVAEDPVSTHGVESERWFYPASITALGPDDADPLAHLVSTVAPRLDHKPEDPNLTSINTALLLATSRYEESLMRSSPEASIAETIAALEAILLSDKDRSGLSRTLSQRAALLVADSDHPPVEIFKKLQQAYDIRSRYVHGTITTNSPNQENGKLLRRTRDVARRIILTLFQLPIDEGKDSLLQRIDYAMIEPKARKKLQQKLPSVSVAAAGTSSLRE